MPFRVSEPFLTLSHKDRDDALETVAAITGRPAHLLEKDVWVVWLLSELYASSVGASLTFKGGTSLSKAYHAIDRFSEDVDLTYDIRTLLPDLVNSELALPPTRSQAKKWTDAVRQRLPSWIEQSITPLVRDALQRNKLDASLEQEGEKLIINYDPLRHGTGYVSPQVVLEFGARSTGEPHARMPVTCDMATHLPTLVFPRAEPFVMALHRTFWEKATAAHVYCLQRRIRDERYARHWHDLAALMRTDGFADIVADRKVAQAVALHKSWFFPEKDADGDTLDYPAAVSGHLKLVPDGQALKVLEVDYQGMIDDGLLFGTTPLSFAELMTACAALEAQVNRINSV